MRLWHASRRGTDRRLGRERCARDIADCQNCQNWVIAKIENRSKLSRIALRLCSEARNPGNFGNFGIYGNIQLMSTSYSNTRPEVAVSEAMTLPQRYYTDPAWFQREMEAIHF